MVDKDKVREGITLLLEGIGEDPLREGLIDTPDRVARMYEELCQGNEMILEKDITFYSICEHHLMPFYGKAHIAYIPDGKVVGISKLARTVEVYARRLQIQEKLTAEIADAIMEYVKPRGVMVQLSAEHMCMTMRGVKKPGSQTVTLVSRGVFKDNKELQDTFFHLLAQ